MSRLRINGSCHCGNIRFVLDWPHDAEVISVRACGCSFCQKHGGVWTSHPDAVLKVSVVDQSAVSKYSFGTRTADFQVCAKCGVAPVVFSDIDEQRYAVVNVNTFDNTADLTLSQSASNFDGEDVASRLVRRQRHWIATVQFSKELPL